MPMVWAIGVWFLRGNEMSNVATIQKGGAVAPMEEGELIGVLQSSLYPGAAVPSIKLVLSYCRAAGLDPLQKPVHIVPMYDKTIRGMRDVIMPGIGLYRTQASRSGQYAGVSEPEFGPDVDLELDGVRLTVPQWCRVTVRRLLGGVLCEFTAREFWSENYATAGRDAMAPNAMWRKRPYGQLAKCAEAQALRKAFPEVGSAPTAEEMEGKDITPDLARLSGGSAEAPAEDPAVAARRAEVLEKLRAAVGSGVEAYAEAWASVGAEGRKLVGLQAHEQLKAEALLASDGGAS